VDADRDMPEVEVGTSIKYTKYARVLSVGLNAQLNDLLNAAVRQTELHISTYIRRALRAQLTKDGIKPPAPASRTRKHDREHQAAHL
jgi:hypothetical protein